MDYHIAPTMHPNECNQLDTEWVLCESNMHPNECNHLFLNALAHGQVAAEASLPGAHAQVAAEVAAEASLPGAHAQVAAEASVLEEPDAEAPVKPAAMAPSIPQASRTQAILTQPWRQPVKPEPSSGSPPPGQSHPAPGGSRSRSPRPRDEPLDIQFARLGLSPKTHMHQCPDIWAQVEGEEFVLRHLLKRDQEQKHVLRAASMTYVILRLTRGAHGVRFATKVLATPTVLSMLLNEEADTCATLQSLAKRILEGASRIGMDRSALSHPEGRHLPRSGAYARILFQSIH